MIYVGLVTYNSTADLPRCIAGLRAQTHPDIRIMAMDNASSDNSAAWLRENAPEVALIAGNENLGYGRAHNQLILSAHLTANDAYVALNPDAELDAGYLASLWRELQRQTETGWVTGRLLMKDEDGQPTGRIYSAGHGLLRSGFGFNIGYGLPDDATYAISREVFGAPGAAVMYAGRLIHDLSESGSFFDPDMFLYAEDTDVDWRARRRGWQCWYVPDAVAYHRGSAPGGKLKMTAVANRYLSVLKNALPRDLALFNLPQIIAHCLARTIVTPRLGVHLARTLISKAPAALRRRKPAKITPKTLRGWYRWSAQQATTQRSLLSKLMRRTA